MAPLSHLKSCLMWETERPDVGVKRHSPYFRMLGEEWYLRLWLGVCGSSQYDCRVRLYRRKGKKTLESAVLTNCHVFTGGRALGNSEQFTVWRSGDLILYCLPTKKDLTPSKDSNNNWTVYCHLSCAEPLSLLIKTEKTLLSTGPATTVTDKSIHLQWLSDDFSRLLDKQMLPDATLMCGDRTWKVHRSVLSARSEVFTAMFRSGMAESKTGAVRVEDVHPSILDALLKYAYSGQVPDLSGENVSGLYEAGDRYALHGLRKACSQWMIENLSGRNCLSYLVVADAHGDDQFKNDVTAFIIEHPVLFESATWADFIKECPSLGVEVLQRFALSTKEGNGSSRF